MNPMTLAANYAKLTLGEKRYLHIRTRLFRVLDVPKDWVRSARVFLRQLMRGDLPRSVVLRTRYVWFVNILRRLRTFENTSAGVGENVIEYNLAALSPCYPSLYARTQLLIRPFSVIETLNADSRILVVGPRSEDDILHLWSYGFRNVRGLDLISYSPYIDLGDMHQMSYGNDTFDAIILGWVLVYSERPENAAKEAVRVAKNGAIIAIGAEYNPKPEEVKVRTVERFGYPVGGQMINSGAEHLNLFDGFVKKVYFLHDIGAEWPERKTNTCVIFSIQK